MKRVGIIGASGQIGTLLSKGLASQGNVDLLRLSRKQEEGFLCFDPFEDSWEKLGTLDVLINAAGIIQESKDADFYRIHVDLVRKIIENRSLLGNPRIVHFSALGAEIESPSAFLKSKALGDEIMEKQSNVLLLRPSIVCTPDTLLVQKLILLLDISRYFFNRALLPTEFPDKQIQPVMPFDLLAAVSKACFEPLPKTKVLEVVGQNAYSFRYLMELAARVRNQRLIPIEIPKNLVGVVTKNFISVWFPGLVSYDQFQLLFKDNTGNKEALEAWLGHPVQDTKAFWQEAFKKEQEGITPDAE